MLGSVNDEILNLEELACELGEFLEKNFPKAMEERYHIVPEEGRRKEEILELVAKERGCLAKGGEADTARAAGLLLDDFRSGRLGRITLEFPEPEKEVQHGE